MSDKGKFIRSKTAVDLDIEKANQFFSQLERDGREKELWGNSIPTKNISQQKHSRASFSQDDFVITAIDKKTGRVIKMTGRSRKADIGQ